MGFDMPIWMLPDQAHSDALAVLADVAGNARDEMEVAGRLQVGFLVTPSLRVPKMLKGSNPSPCDMKT